MTDNSEPARNSRQLASALRSSTMVDEKALYAAATAALNARRKANGWPATTLDKMLTPDRDAWIEDVQAAISAYLQALSPGSTGEAEGWVLVPKEPTEEEIACVIMCARDNGACEVKDWAAEEQSNPHVGQALRQARAVLALFAPVLAEKERLIRELAALLDKQLGTPCEQIRHRQEADDLRAQIANLTERTRLPVIADYIEVQNHSRAMEARALAAEAALAGRDAEIAKAVAEAYEDAAKVRESRIEKLPLSSSSSDYDCEAAACAAATPEDNGA